MEQTKIGNLILENRKKLILNAVNDVINFDEETLVLNTQLGILTIKGENLHIVSFDTTSAELTAEGDFFALVYTEAQRKEKLFKKVFK